METPSPELGSPLTDVLPFLGTFLVGVLGWFGVRFTATAPLQASLNDAFKILVTELQLERSVHVAQISELERGLSELQNTLARSLKREMLLQQELDRLKMDRIQ